MRFFNTAGPVVAEMHYCVPPLGRLDADELLLLIRQRKVVIECKVLRGGSRAHRARGS